MPFFAPATTPERTFPNCCAASASPATRRSRWRTTRSLRQLAVPHGTTCVAVRYGGGVVMAGDRRATAGNLISHRSMEKVVEADRHSGVAIAGTAGPAMEMIRLFQLQLEHYEKVEGTSLSLEGKANQLSMMVRSNLPAALQGMVVVPIFAGYDLRREVGRLWAYDATGGRYEERDHVATGSGSLHAEHGHQGRLPPRHDPRRGGRPRGDRAVGGGRRRLGDRGPDALRGIYPVVAAIDADGWARSPTTTSPPVRGDRGGGELAMSMPFYVAPEQMMKDRADYARKGIARGRALVALRDTTAS